MFYADAGWAAAAFRRHKHFLFEKCGILGASRKASISFQNWQAHKASTCREIVDRFTVYFTTGKGSTITFPTRSF